MTPADAKLARSDIAMLDAIAFVVFDAEEGAPPGGPPLKRTIKDSSIEYLQPMPNPDLSDRSVYGLTVEASSPEECIFTINLTINVPDKMKPPNSPSGIQKTGIKVDLNRMKKFEVRKFPLNATVTFFGVSLEGTQIYCEDNKCKDKHISDMSVIYNVLKTPALQAEFLTRRERAIDFIKKSCPGKPY